MFIKEYSYNSSPQFSGSLSIFRPSAMEFQYLNALFDFFPNFPDGKLFSGYRNRIWDVEEMDGIRVVRVKTLIAANAGTVLRILDYLSFMITSFMAGLFVPRPDLVATTSPTFFAAVGGCALAAVRGLPFVLEVADLWPDSIVAVGAMKRNLMLRWLEKIELLLYRRAARIVVLTQAFRENLVRRGVSADKIDVVINGVDLLRYQPQPKDATMAVEWGLGDANFVVGYIGTHGMAHALENVLSGCCFGQGVRHTIPLCRHRRCAEPPRRGSGTSWSTQCPLRTSPAERNYADYVGHL
jgi:glycosyltransferase involved in cell wall biosynthesis